MQKRIWKTLKKKKITNRYFNFLLNERENNEMESQGNKFSINIQTGNGCVCV